MKIKKNMIQRSRHPVVPRPVDGGLGGENSLALLLIVVSQGGS